MKFRYSVPVDLLFTVDVPEITDDKQDFAPAEAKAREFLETLIDGVSIQSTASELVALPPDVRIYTDDSGELEFMDCWDHV